MLGRLKIIIFAIALLLAISHAQSHAEISRIRLLFVGDIMAHQQQLDAAKRKDSWDFSPQFRRIRPLIENAFLIGNLETTFAGTLQNGRKLSYTGYPMFNTPDSLADNLKDLDFDLLTLANNHIFDKGSDGAKRTTEILDSCDIPWLGLKIENSQTSRDAAILEHDGFKLAFINYTYGSNIFPRNYPESSDVKLNIISDDVIQNSIISAKNLSADIITACFHWGYEYHYKPNTQQKHTAEIAFESGANLIIGTHPHVLQPVEIISDDAGNFKSVAWSLGNFVSFQRTLPRERTCILAAEFEKNDSGFTRLTRISIAPLYVHAPGQKRTEIIYAGSYEPMLDTLDFSGISKQKLRQIRQIGNVILEFMGAKLDDVDDFGFYTLWSEENPDELPISRRKTPK